LIIHHTARRYLTYIFVTTALIDVVATRVVVVITAVALIDARVVAVISVNWEMVASGNTDEHDRRQAELSLKVSKEEALSRRWTDHGLSHA